MIKNFFHIEGIDVKIGEHLMVLQPFKRIWTRDKDRTKKLASAELLYIFYMHDHRSPLAVYDDDQRKDKTVLMLELNQLTQKKTNKRILKWKVDRELQIAISIYLKLTITPSIKALNEARKGVMLAAETMKFLRKQLDADLILADQSYTDDLEEQKRIDKLKKDIMANMKYLFELADKMPKLLSTLDDLQERVEKQASEDTSSIRGRGRIGMFEN